MITFIRIALGGLLGWVLAINGLTVLTWGFWAVFVIALAMAVAAAYEDF
jgi:hypothetical protein